MYSVEKAQIAAVLGSQNVHWTILYDPSFTSPLDQAIQLTDVTRLLTSQGFLQALEVEENSVMHFLTSSRSISLILDTMLQTLPVDCKCNYKKVAADSPCPYSEEEISAVDALLQTARFGSRFYNALIDSAEFAQFLRDWLQSDICLNPRQSARFASLLKSVVWHKNRRLKFISLLNSVLVPFYWKNWLRCICNQYMVESLLTIFNTCMPNDDSLESKTLMAYTYEHAITCFDIRSFLHAELDTYSRDGYISYVDAMRIEHLCGFINEVIAYNHPMLQEIFYDCVLILANFFFRDSLVISDTSDYIVSALNAIGSAILPSMSLLLRSTYSYICQPEVVVKLYELLNEQPNTQQLQTPVFGKQITPIDSIVFSLLDIPSETPSSSTPGRSRSRLYEKSNLKDQLSTQVPTDISPSLVMQLGIPHVAILDSLWALFSNSNTQLIEYLRLNYCKYVLRFYEDTMNVGALASPLAPRLSAIGPLNDGKSRAESALESNRQRKETNIKARKSRKIKSSLSQEESSVHAWTGSRFSSIVSETSQSFTGPEDLESISTIDISDIYRDRKILSQEPREHSRSLSYAGKKRRKSGQYQAVDKHLLTNNSFSNIYLVSNNGTSLFRESSMLFEDAPEQKRKSTTFSRTLNPKKIIAQYNPFIKHHSLNCLRGLQDDISDMCTFFITKTPKPLPLALIIRLQYVVRILSIISDVRCREYYNRHNCEPTCSFNNVIHKSEESIGYAANYTADFPPTVECSCGGPSEVTLESISVFLGHYYIPYSSPGLAAQILSINYLFPLIDCLGPIYRDSHMINMLGSRIRQCAIDLTSLYPNLLTILFPISADRYDSFTAAIAMSSSPLLRRSTFCIHLVSNVKTLLRKSLNIPDEDLYRSKFTNLQIFATALRIAPKLPSDIPITPIVPLQSLRGFQDTQNKGNLTKSTTNELHFGGKASKAIFGTCGRSDRFQCSSVDYTQSELIYVNSPPRQRGLKKEMRLANKYADDSISDFTNSAVVDNDHKKTSESFPQTKRGLKKLTLSLDISQETEPLKEIIIPWTREKLIEIIQQSKVPTDTINLWLLDVCMKRRDIQIINKLYLSNICSQKIFSDDHNTFMAVLFRYSCADNTNNRNQSNPFTTSTIVESSYKRSRYHGPNIQLPTSLHERKVSRDQSSKTQLSDSVIQFATKAQESSSGTSGTKSVIHTMAQENYIELGNPNNYESYSKTSVKKETAEEDREELDMLRGICDEQV